MLHNPSHDYIEVDADIGERIRRTARDIEKLLWLRDIELITSSNYIVKGLLYAGDISFWFGQSGFGKSFLVTDIAAHIAAGRDFLGRKVRQTGVLIVPLEGQRGAKKRLYAIRKEFGEDLKLAIYEDSLDLSSGTGDVNKLIKTMRQRVCRLRLPRHRHTIAFARIRQRQRPQGHEPRLPAVRAHPARNRRTYRRCPSPRTLRQGPSTRLLQHQAECRHARPD